MFLLTLIIKCMGELMSHDHPHGSEVYAGGVVDAVEGGTQDPRRKNDLIFGGGVVGVHCERRHIPSAKSQN